MSPMKRMRTGLNMNHNDRKGHKDRVDPLRAIRRIGLSPVTTKNTTATKTGRPRTLERDRGREERKTPDQTQDTSDASLSRGLTERKSRDVRDDGRESRRRN